jgi:alpha-L-arabinofuranosidase
MGTTVYLGEFAAHERDRRNTLRSALAEAAYMTALERNGDVVRLASYAPLLAKQRHLHWVPDLIYFDNTAITRSVNYYVQQLFSLNAGDAYLPTVVTTDGNETLLATSCVRDLASGDIIMKLVSRADVPVRAEIDLSRAGVVEPQAQCTVLTGDPLAVNEFGRRAAVLPTHAIIDVAPRFTYGAPAHSLSILRVKTFTAA